MFISSCLCFLLYAHHRDLHVLTHSFPTRRSADLGRLARDLPTDCPQVGTKPVGRALIHLVTRTAHGECGRLWRRRRHCAMRHCRCADHGCKQVTQNLTTGHILLLPFRQPLTAGAEYRMSGAAGNDDIRTSEALAGWVEG